MYDIVILQGMISVAVDMLPLPGGMGISEKLFSMLFTGIFGQVKVLAGLILKPWTELLHRVIDQCSHDCSCAAVSW